MKPALKVENLRKSFGGNEVVKGISFEIQPGEIFGLLGPNGAGKSTTINMITGVSSVGSGKVEVFGIDNQADYIGTRRLTGVMHQEIVVDTFFTIDQALKIHSGYYSVPDDSSWRNLLIDRLALRPHLKKSMNKLSGGMKRRFMVAKALIHKPKLLILDEPTAGVDVELRQNLWEFVREINQKEKTTVVLTTHYLEEAQEMCERVAIMNHGNIIALDKTSSLLEKLDEKKFFIHLKEKALALPDVLASFDCHLLNDGNTLSINLRGETKFNDVLMGLAKCGLTVRDVETKSPSLQEAFLKITKSNRAAHA
ncbi:MAG: ABC transporter ATP-binding protein [Oligoflexia bacterium]|nr:ABC transporter ATP-binding protein [Oligoflexia bacterium]